MQSFYILFSLLLIIGIAVLSQYLELQRFRVTTYSFSSGKIKKDLNILYLSDLHGKTYQGRLLEEITKQNPDYIFIGGDLISKKHYETFDTIIPFLIELVDVAPVYYVFGNHETSIDQRLSISDYELGQDMEAYLDIIQNLGIRILHNEGASLEEGLSIFGMELDDEYFQKFKEVPFCQDYLKAPSEFFHENSADYKILLSHAPCYAREYAKCNPDLILCGHTHGGLVRFPVIGSVISTELTLFPKYDGGLYDLTNFTPGKNKCSLIVGKGLGTHTFHIRILDRAEIVRIHLESF